MYFSFERRYKMGLRKRIFKRKVLILKPLLAYVFYPVVDKNTVAALYRKQLTIALLRKTI